MNIKRNIATTKCVILVIEAPLIKHLFRLYLACVVLIANLIHYKYIRMHTTVFEGIRFITKLKLAEKFAEYFFKFFKSNEKTANRFYMSAS